MAEHELLCNPSKDTLIVVVASDVIREGIRDELKAAKYTLVPNLRLPLPRTPRPIVYVLEDANRDRDLEACLRAVKSASSSERVGLHLYYAYPPTYEERHVFPANMWEIGLSFNHAVPPPRTLNVYPNAVMGKFIPFCSPADLLAASVLMQHAVHIEPHGMIFNAATGLQTTRGDNRVEVKRIRDSVLSRVGATEPEMLRDLGAYFRLKCDQCGQYNLKNRLCSRCGLAAYCSVECQKADWSNHKAFCKTKPK